MQRAFKIAEKLPLQRELAKERIKVKQQKQIEQKAGTSSQKLRIGQKILLYRNNIEGNMSAKLENRWTGSFYVHEVLQGNNYKLRSLDSKIMKGMIHGNRLKEYYEQIMKLTVII